MLLMLLLLMQIDEDDREKNTSLHLAALCVNKDNAVRLVTMMCQIDHREAVHVNSDILHLIF